MKKGVKILSTKKLNKNSLNELKINNIEVNEFEFITIEFLNKNIESFFSSQKPLIDKLIVFTSRNAIVAVTEFRHLFQNCTFYVIGKSSLELAEKTFISDRIYGSYKSAEEIANFLISLENKSEVLFFCGDRRLDNLPEKLRSNGWELTEVVVYKTALSPKKVDGDYEGILFFSPSGVESFAEKNSFSEKAKYFAIGPTTGRILEGHLTNIVTYVKKNILFIPDEPSEKKLIDLTIEELRRND